MTASRTPAVRTSVLLLAAVLAIALVGLGARAAVSAPPLPEIGADELLGSALVAAADPPPVAGELSLTLGFGLPSVPGVTDEDGGLLAELLGGASRLRVERSEDGLRAALLGRSSERLLVTDGNELWTWDSTTLEATRFALPDLGEGAEEREAPDLSAFDPAALGGRFLEGLDAGADVALDRTGRVAGRDTYRLVITPDDQQTTVGKLEVDVDAEQRVPLRVALFARGAVDPSFEVTWTSVSFDPVDPATFSFTPPPGATVRDGLERLEDLREGIGEPAGQRRGTDAPLVHGDDGSIRHAPGAATALRGAGMPSTEGEGLSTVLVVPVPPADAARDGDASGAQLEALLPLDGPLLSATLTTTPAGDRVLLLGLVPLARLDEVAAGLG